MARYHHKRLIAAFWVLCLLAVSGLLGGPEKVSALTEAAVPLQRGWNLISVPVVPTSAAIADALHSIAGQYDLVYAYDAADADALWQKYNPSVPAVLNSLTQLDERVGLWIRATSAVTLTLSGTVPAATNIPLVVGWNLVGYPCQATLAVGDALTYLAGSYDLVYAYDSADAGDPWRVYSTAAPAGASLASMAPGRGYWIHATRACTLSLGPSGPVSPPPCPLSSSDTYASGTAYQQDLDNPVRPAYNHADKNLALRSYAVATDPSVKRELVNYGTDDPTQPPQLATLFNPTRVPPIANLYRVYNWNWAPSPNPGTRGALLSTLPVTALGLSTTPGEALRVPTSGYDIGQGMEVIVLYADEDSITFKYTREDSVQPNGYTLHVDKICTDPNLLALYNALDNPSGPRYQYKPPSSRPYGYNVPTLATGQAFGVARGTEVVVAIRDTGSFMDPRSCNEWWQIRPGYTGTCPQHE